MRCRFLACAGAAAAALLLLLSVAAGSSHAAVMGLDIGTDTFKVSLIRGKSFDIVLNSASGRKTPSAAAFDRAGALHIGTDARSLASRFPHRTFEHMLSLLGADAAENSRARSLINDHNILSYSPRPLAANLTHFQSRLEAGEFPSDVPRPHASSRFGLAVERRMLGPVADDEDAHEEALLPIEAAFALILQEARDMASSEAGVRVRDAVIAVPPFWAQRERQALLDAAELAEISVLGLINAPSAAGVQWGLPKEFSKNESTYMVVYDMGHSSTSASVLAFKATTPDKQGLSGKKASSAALMEVVATAWDASLGGVYFDERIVEHWLKELSSQGHAEVAQNRRVLAKLYKEARRTKEILSANKEAHIMIEGLFDEFDFKSELTRDQFEDMCSELFERAVGPLKTIISEFVSDGSHSINDLAAIEIVGGGVRIPLVQQKLQEFLSERGRTVSRDDSDNPNSESTGSLLDRHLNGDEAAVMGAAFHCANLSPNVRVTQFKVKDNIGFTSSMRIRSDDGKVDREQPLFGKGARLGSKKSLTLSVDSNLTIAIRTSSDLNPKESTNAVYRVTGILRRGEEKGDYNFTAKPKLSLVIRLSQAGVVFFDHALAEHEVEEWQQVRISKKQDDSTKVDLEDVGHEADASVDTAADEEEGVDTIKDEAGTDSGRDGYDETDDAVKDSAEDVDGKQNSPENSSDGSKAESKADEPKFELKRVHKVKRFPCSVDLLWSSGLSTDDKYASRAIVQSVNSLAAERKQREAARNTLEGFVYATQDKLEQAEWQEVTSPEQRENLSEQLAAAGEWLYEEGVDAPASEYDAKLRSMQKIVTSIELRLSEREALPEATARLRDVANLTEMLYSPLNDKYDEDVILSKFAQVQADAAAEAEAEAEAEAATEAAEAEAATEAATEAAAEAAAQDATEANAQATASDFKDTAAGEDADVQIDQSESVEKNVDFKEPKPLQKKAKKPKVPVVYKYAAAKRQKIKDSEIDEILSKASDSLVWLEDKLQLQGSLESHEEPVLLSKDVNAKADKLDSLSRRLMRRAFRKSFMPKFDMPFADKWQKQPNEHESDGDMEQDSMYEGHHNDEKTDSHKGADPHEAADGTEEGGTCVGEQCEASATK